MIESSETPNFAPTYADAPFAEIVKGVVGEVAAVTDSALGVVVFVAAAQLNPALTLVAEPVAEVNVSM